ncbi:MAG: Gfo/Idh/MocA family oxidoreductase [Phycisphaerae bacterium]|nr:Gfo/Idh/MocA family oxidoreductase [Phycisphaerae bacterium]
MANTVGVIGGGQIARFHFDALQKIQADVRWVCDLQPDTAAAWAKPFNAKVTTEYQDVLSDPAVSVVHILTPSPTHRTVCLEAIQAGKAVICEKTLATNSRDAWDIVQAARRTGTIFYTSYMKRFIPAVQKARQLLPRIGGVLTTHARVHQCWGDDDFRDETPPDHFTYTPEGGHSRFYQSAGGGILLCGGSHILDLLIYLLGRPAGVFGRLYMPDRRDADLLTAAMLQTADAGVIHFEAMIHKHKHIGFLRDGWDERIEFVGREGRVTLLSSEWNQVEQKASLLVHYDNFTGLATEYRFDPVSPFALAIASFHENIAAGQQGDQSPITGYEVDEVIEHIRQSSRRNQSLDIAWRDS